VGMSTNKPPLTVLAQPRTQLRLQPLTPPAEEGQDSAKTDRRNSRRTWQSQTQNIAQTVEDAERRGKDARRTCSRQRHTQASAQTR
jgi:hypothetical protein